MRFHSAGSAAVATQTQRDQVEESSLRVLNARAGRYQRDHSAPPVQSLIAAIVQRALDDLDLGSNFRSRALAWVYDASSAQRPGSFEWCCAALGLNADAVRSRYRDLRNVAGPRS